MNVRRGILFDERGVTLVELIVASAIGVIASLAVLYFVGIAGEGTNLISGRQQLEQETAIIAEIFTRSIRNGSFVCVNAGTAAPTADMDNLSKITVRGADGAAVATFEISGDSLKMNGTRYLTAYLCGFKSPASHFKVFQNGKHAEFYLSMLKVVGNDSIAYCQTIGDVRCRN